MSIITMLPKFAKERSGISNVIVMILSLVILVIVTSNVILWSYEMNQLDWEKTNENLEISNAIRVNSSSWFVAQNEYYPNKGNHAAGSYIDTQSINNQSEIFTEELGYTLEINGTFTVDITTYPLDYTQTIEILLIYNSSDISENWYLKAYNWITTTYSDVGFNTTSGNLPTTNWDSYAVNLTDKWRNYINADGVIHLRIQDNQEDTNQTNIYIDFLGVRVVTDGVKIFFNNKGASTLHLVSLWINNSTHYRRYDINIFINSGDTASHVQCDFKPTKKPYVVKVVTEKGNIALYAKG